MTHPSCHGLPSVYNAQSPTCAGCKSRQSCVDACKVLLRQLMAEQTQPDPRLTAPGTAAPVQFDLREGKTPKYELTPEQKETLAGLPKKVGVRYLSMVKKGFDRQVLDAVQRGQNPFVHEGQRFLHLALALMLDGGVTKADLKQRFRADFNWSDGTAASFVSICVALLPALGVGQVEGSFLLLHPNMVLKNAA